MRILFVCASVEPGKDGVGDYTTCLSEELLRKGHEISIAAINDRYISSAVSATEYLPGTSSINRFPSQLSWAEREKMFREAVSRFNPQFISVQYVPYAYSKLGVPIGLPSFLRKNANGIAWHLMVHEPFIKLQNATIKSRLVRFGQISSLKKMIHDLKPKIVHTSILQYHKMLKDERISSEILGLFGNMPITSSDQATFQQNMAVYFGALPPVSQQEILINKLKDCYSKMNCTLHLVICGNNGSSLNEFVKGFDGLEHIIKLDVRGRLDSIEIARIFADAHFGISRVPCRLVGKSGTAIAMLEHGLPLWLPIVESENDLDWLDFRKQQCFLSLPDLLERGKKIEAVSLLPQIANQFIESLEAH